MLANVDNFCQHHQASLNPLKRVNALEHIMPRVTHVKSAQKDNPVCKKGESYYWWKRKNCAKQFSLTYPKASQLTGSAYFGAIYDLQEQVQNAEITDEDEFEGFRDEISGCIREQGDECQNSLDNMPESLQYSPTGELLQERIDACESAADEIENIEAPDEWNDIKEAQDDHEAWKEREPQLEDFEDEPDGETAQDQFDDAHDNWEGEDGSEEPDEPEAIDLSEMDDALSNCIV